MGQNESSCQARNCGPCSQGNPNIDTVKVDSAAIRRKASASDKENAPPAPPAPTSAEKKATQEAEERRRAEETRRAEELQRAEEARRLEAEQQRRRMEVEEAWRLHEEEERRRRIDEERLAAERAIEEREQEAQARALEEERRRAEESQRLEQQRRAQERMDQSAAKTFLEENGFPSGDVNARRRRGVMMKSKCPLHVAVKQGNAQMLEILLRLGADASQKSSTGLSPAEYALRLDKDGSHREVLFVLEAAGRLSKSKPVAN